jgi:hypothetical protein
MRWSRTRLTSPAASSPDSGSLAEARKCLSKVLDGPAPVADARRFVSTEGSMDLPQTAVVTWPMDKPAKKEQL